MSNDNVIQLICADCFGRQIFEEECKEGLYSKIEPKIKYPRGWALRKKFVAPDGKVFSFGKQIKPKVKTK